jgi:GTP cyclohydrolase I
MITTRIPDIQPDLVAAARHAAAMMETLGMPCDGPRTADTPRRLVAAYADMTRGRFEDPSLHLATTFPAEHPDPCMIVVREVPFVALCEHHMLPFTGHATVGYLPAEGADIVGLSKLARVVQGYAARPQVQERLGRQVVDAITNRLGTQGAACVIRAVHTCMTLRGAGAVGAEMVTSHLLGVFRDDTAVRVEFLSLAGGR